MTLAYQVVREIHQLERIKNYDVIECKGLGVYARSITKKPSADFRDVVDLHRQAAELDHNQSLPFLKGKGEKIW